MARKSKRDDLAAKKTTLSQADVTDPGRQPRIVGWLVLIVGGFSSWYWYRPLPDSVSQTVHSTIPTSWPTSKSGPKSLWSDSGLVVPSTSGEPNNRAESRVDSSRQLGEESRLIGPPKITLLPWNEGHHDIRDALKTERVPMVPMTRDLIDGKLKSKSPQVWTPETQQSTEAGNTTQFNSNWPDVGYVLPEKISRAPQPTTVQITTQIPPLLETGMKSIRTADALIESDRANGFSNSNSKSSESALPPSPEATRHPMFIRQPKRKN
ncbi:MAG TPA: hypothetical protein VM260_09745 [Pirellula sp.]|nr:hypothetical protein [Pirellula sp.]